MKQKTSLSVLKKLTALTFVSAVSMFSICEEEPVKVETPIFKPELSATAAEVNDFISSGHGGSGAKLVFIDKTLESGKLCYIDFSETADPVVIHEISAAKEPELPVISPDGEWVVYASGSGTEAGSPVKMRSSVYICRLDENATPVLVAKDSACEPRFEQNPKDGKQVVIYPTLAPNHGWEGFGKTMKVEVDVSGSTPDVGTPEVLYSEGSFTGGLSADGKFICGGGGDIAMLDLSSDAAKPETLSYNGGQSCNASISSSSLFTNTMMYLTLESSHPAINDGESWETWQVILISNIKKELCRGYVVPSQYENSMETVPASFSNVKWHHPEWSNHPYFAAATINVDRYFSSGSGFSNTGYQERIYIINLLDSAYLEILRPDAIKYSGVESDQSGFHWPWLWVQIPDDFSEEADWLKAL